MSASDKLSLSYSLYLIYCIPLSYEYSLLLSVHLVFDLALKQSERYIFNLHKLSTYTSTDLGSIFNFMFSFYVYSLSALADMPKSVDIYVLSTKIGQGQFGDVFRGFNKTDGT